MGTGKQDHALQATGGPAGPVVLTPLKQREPSFKSLERKVNIEQLLLDHTGFSVVFFPPEQHIWFRVRGSCRFVSWHDVPISVE